MIEVVLVGEVDDAVSALGSGTQAVEVVEITAKYADALGLKGCG